MVEIYVKESVKIEAVQWTGKNVDEISRFMNKDKSVISDSFCNLPSDKIMIKTLEDVYNASIGDYIVKGIKGEFYLCKPDIFKRIIKELISHG